MGEPEIRRLLTERAIEQIEPDRVTSAQELEVARRHVASARQIGADDPVGAFAIGYDAIRKAITAHMRARGYRLRKGAAHHRRTGRYAFAALDHLDVVRHIDAFDDLRQLRNQSEYDAFTVEPGDVRDVLEHASGLIDAIEDDLAF